VGRDLDSGHVGEVMGMRGQNRHPGGSQTP